MPENKINDRISLSSEIRLSIFCLLIFGIYLLFDKSDRLEPVLVIDEQIAVSSVEIVRGDPTKNQIILTFDGGDGNNSGPAILSTLKKHGVKSSFFLTGKFAQNNRDFVKQMAIDGHEIYNHTYSHPYMTQISNEQIAFELLQADKIIYEITGKTTKPYFRPPYGDRDDRVRDQAFKNGYQSVLWVVDALDWQENLGRSAEEVRYRVVTTLAPGNIYLMHMGDNITGNILDELLTTIKEKGYNIVSLKQGI